MILPAPPARTVELPSAGDRAKPFQQIPTATLLLARAFRLVVEPAARARTPASTQRKLSPGSDCPPCRNPHSDHEGKVGRESGGPGVRPGRREHQGRSAGRRSAWQSSQAARMTSDVTITIRTDVRANRPVSAGSPNEKREQYGPSSAVPHCPPRDRGRAQRLPQRRRMPARQGNHPAGLAERDGWSAVVQGLQIGARARNVSSLGTFSLRRG